MPTSKSAEPILVTMGEPAGVGPEVAVAAWRALGGHVGERKLILVGAPDVFASYGKVPDDAVLATTAAARRTPGRPDPANAKATVEAIARAVNMAIEGTAGAIVTAPINKAVLLQTGFRFPGHTDYLAHLTSTPRAVMMLASGTIRVVPLTVHVPLAWVPRLITMDAIIETAEITLAALKRDFGIEAPRLAVAGLNPHAGEQGLFGTEEMRVIAPAVRAARRSGIDARGPFAADSLFPLALKGGVDAVVCMYHDQGLAPFKLLHFTDGVNVTIGLPFVRTSPDHGTAHDIAGRGVADPGSMAAALRLAAALAQPQPKHLAGVAVPAARRRLRSRTAGSLAQSAQ